MTVKMFCDGPTCGSWVATTTPDWLTVNRRDDNNTPKPVLNFCGWPCTVSYAAAQDVAEAVGRPES